jgi:hypothetical protein
MSLLWNPPVELSEAERNVLKHCKSRKIFIFFREYRHQLFPQSFQAELGQLMYKPRRAGSEIVPPALLALVTLLQAALHVSDDEAVRLSATDRCWQLVLGTLGQEESPFCKGDLYHFRTRLIAQELDRNLLERTVALARETGGFGATNLRVAFDASPLLGAGRVEDFFNLLGHAARQILVTAAMKLHLSFEETAQQAGIPLLTGKSLKAMLDIDWNDPTQRKSALEQLLSQVQSLQSFLQKELAQELAKPPLKEQCQTLATILEQNTEPDPEGGGKKIRKGVAKDRRVSISDPDMRHGRKSKSKKFNGYRRHVAVDVKADLILGVEITKGNEPEGEGAKALFEDIERQKGEVVELDTDRGYLWSKEVQKRRQQGMGVNCKPYPLRNHGLFTKADFQLALEKQTVTCPAGQTVLLQIGKTARFPQEKCDSCHLKSKCTKSKTGRTLSIHEQEGFLIELRQKQKTKEGRVELRKRTTAEHLLARVSGSQGNRSRYRGERKNLFDLRRHAAVVNCHRMARIPEKTQVSLAV